MLVSDPRYVTGRFNAHLLSLLILHADEAFWAGDRAAEGKIRDLVTGYSNNIEFKNMEIVRVASFVRLFVTGGTDWIVPAAFRERRFAVLDVAHTHIQDTAYFAAIDQEMENGGAEALLHYLLNFDLKTVNLREIPKTAALLEQQLTSMDPQQNWWLDVLQRGELPSTSAEKNCCETEELFRRYIKHANRQGTRHRASETQIGMFLNKVVPDLRKGRKTVASQRVPTYTFPSLQECRKAFAKALGQDLSWPFPDEDWEVAALDTDRPF